MGYTFIYGTLPVCSLTPERVAELTTLITTTEPKGDFDLQDLLDPRKHALHALTKYPLFECSRDVSEINLPISGKSVPHYITGGLSWGDAPTDTYEFFQDLRAFPAVAEKLVEWAVEDSAKITADQTPA